VVGGLTHQGNDNGGVESAGEKGAEGDIADHSHANGLGKFVADCLLGVIKRADEIWFGRQGPIALGSCGGEISAVEEQAMGRRELFDAGESGLGVWDVLE